MGSIPKLIRLFLTSAIRPMDRREVTAERTDFFFGYLPLQYFSGAILFAGLWTECVTSQWNPVNAKWALLELGVTKTIKTKTVEWLGRLYLISWSRGTMESRPPCKTLWLGVWADPKDSIWLWTWNWWISVCMIMYVYEYVYIYVYIYMCIYICIYIYVYI